MNQKLFIIFLLLIMFILGFFLGENITEYSIEKRYKTILENNLSYCLYGNNVYIDPRVPKIKIERNKNETN